MPGQLGMVERLVDRGLGRLVGCAGRLHVPPVPAAVDFWGRYNPSQKVH